MHMKLNILTGSIRKIRNKITSFLPKTHDDTRSIRNLKSYIFFKICCHTYDSVFASIPYGRELKKYVATFLHKMWNNMC